MSSKVGLTPSSTSPMVRELLNQDNYAEWHVWMKNYLLGQDLWDVIVEVQSPDCDIDTAEFKSWKRKNAAALHAIHMSCGSEALSVTMENDITAKKAWDALYNKYRSMATCLELDEDKSADIPDINDYAQDATFYKALQEGKWEAAKDFIDTHRDTLNRRIAPFGKTVLHAAVEFGHFNIMKELLKLMSKEAIEIRDNEGDTTLATLTSAGSIEMAKWVVKRNKNVLTIANNRKWIPVSLAIKYRHIEMARYLYSVTPFEELVGEKETYGATLLCQCYYLRLMDMALDLVKRCPDFAIAPDNFDRTLVLRLATIPSAFPSGSNLSFWQQWIYDWIQIKPSSSANHVQLNIDNDDQRRECDENIIVHPCLRERLISDIHNFLDALVSSLDSRKNNMLHVAGELAPLTELNRISDAALQMQRELQWFKEVESIVPPYMQEALNIDKKTPRDVFTENHKELVKEGERWMKETASSCTVVGALIVTIMFAAAFTFPGGNNDNGSPIFLNHKLFMLFMISDAISLFSSSTSVLMFLRILTSRYAEEDFLESLPKRLMIGLSALFFSIATMMITFCAAMYFTLHGQSWIFIPVTLLATIPVTLFMLLQFPPLVQIFNSTYRPVIFNREVNRWF
ncbi:Ankyrin repeat family protein [Quillaja saponaria]|uniref:Ankyrin repeat family protein n=1 Tax=Quillaja saponaria TaxID=32244 RepID=A0AAD7VGK2_QUISA|nr:Ankyrin repeat family protein [Quillaja saponaria]